MRKLIGLLLVVGLVLGLVMSVGAAGADSGDVMLVVYLESWNGGEDLYLTNLRWDDGYGLYESDNKLYVTGLYSVDYAVCNNLTYCGYGFYEYKPIELNFSQGLPTMASLDLVPITADNLPQSTHIAKLKAVDIGANKPLTVTRKFQGLTYDVQCFVSQSVVELYLDGKVAIGDFVIVDYIDESPNDVALNIPIVVDKVYKSW